MIHLLQKMVACFFVMLSILACSEENFPQIEKQLPVAVMRDFAQRFGDVSIASYTIYSEDIEIKFTDAGQNQSTAFYVDNQWSMTVTNLSDLEKLPRLISKQLSQTPYAKLNPEQILGIERIERRELSHVLYTLKFTYPYHEYQRMYHEVLLNEDGTQLLVRRECSNDQRNFVSLVQSELDYIQVHYAGADIRGYINDGGDDCFLFVHDGILKQIYFDNTNRNRPEEWSWKKTISPLPVDASIPASVLAHLKATDPTFHYTEVFFIETPDGNGYMFIDGESANRLGYTIGDGSV